MPLTVMEERFGLKRILVLLTGCALSFGIIVPFLDRIVHSPAITVIPLNLYINDYLMLAGLAFCSVIALTLFKRSLKP